jgi:hypothetical protein
VLRRHTDAWRDERGHRRLAGSAEAAKGNEHQFGALQEIKREIEIGPDFRAKRLL